MKSKIGVAALLGVLAVGLLATTAAAQCSGYPGPMIKFDSNGYAYETNYWPTLMASQPGSQLTVVGQVSLFCEPFLDLDANDPNIEYTFVWDGLVSQGTSSRTIGTMVQYTTGYTGGGFRIYAGTPKNVPGILPALPAAGIIPDTYGDGTLILSGVFQDGFSVLISRTGTSTYTYSGSFRTNYQCTGGTLFSRVGSGSALLSGLWCPVPPSGNPAGTCALPAGWNAHPNGKWDSPQTTPAAHRTWGTIKTMYR
jgi:hypothetical protein